MDLQLYLYPRIIGIHNLAPEDGFPDSSGRLRFPRTARASFGFIREGDAYLVDNGQYLLLWLHSLVSPLLLADLFGEGAGNLGDLDPLMLTLPVLDTQLNTQVRNIIQYVASQRGAHKLSIQLARQGMDGAEYEFANALVEDRNGDERSYVDWLVHVHKMVQLEVSGHSDVGSDRRCDRGGWELTLRLGIGAEGRWGWRGRNWHRSGWDGGDQHVVSEVDAAEGGGCRGLGERANHHDVGSWFAIGT